MNPAASQTASLTSRASWLMFAKTVGFSFSVALPLLLVRRLDQVQFGLYKQVFLVVGTAVNLLPLAFSMSAFYYLPREPDKRPQTIFNIMAFNILVGVLASLLLLFRPSILTAIFREPQLGAYAPLIGVVILTWIVGAFLEGVPIANEEIKLATKFIIGTHLARACLLVMAALLFGTVRSLICAAMTNKQARARWVPMMNFVASLISSFAIGTPSKNAPTIQVRLTTPIRGAYAPDCGCRKVSGRVDGAKNNRRVARTATTKF